MLRNKSTHKNSAEFLKENKLIRGKKMWFSIILIFSCILIGVLGQLFLKKGLTAVGGFAFSEIFSPRVVTIFLNPMIFFGTCCYAGSMVLWLVALSMFDLSFLYPLLSISYILNAFSALFFLKENVPPMRWVGIVVVMCGVVFIVKS